jgi:hypothetical protein
MSVMQHRLYAIAVMSALALAPSASPASAGGGKPTDPVQHLSIPATEIFAGDGPIVCGDHEYEFTSGTFLLVFRDSSVAAHATFVNVRARDNSVPGSDYRVVGTETYSEPNRFVAKITFIAKGAGVVESINIVVNERPNGKGPYFSFGSCIPNGWS